MTDKKGTLEQLLKAAQNETDDAILKDVKERLKNAKEGIKNTGDDNVFKMAMDQKIKDKIEDKTTNLGELFDDLVNGISNGVKKRNDLKRKEVESKIVNALEKILVLAKEGNVNEICIIAGCSGEGYMRQIITVQDPVKMLGLLSITGHDLKGMFKGEESI